VRLGWRRVRGRGDEIKVGADPAALIKKELGLAFLRPFLATTELIVVKTKRRK
jgi:hypothetical protein